jgi:monoamine oxidase
MIAIQELAIGSNSKLNVQFNSRPWGAPGCNGETYSDRGYQATWDVTRAQPGTQVSSLITQAARSPIPLATALPRSTLKSFSLRLNRCCRA